MNKKLPFSFGHTVAIISLIFVSYITFMGLMYWNEGNFTPSIISTLAIGVILYTLLIFLQKLKGTSKNFKTAILLERIFLIVFIISCIGAFIPFSHFWTVYDNRKEIEAEFDDALGKSRNIFSEYEKYANERIEDYRLDLNRVVNSKKNNPSQYKEYGFSEDFDDYVQLNNFESLLQQILLSENYRQLDSLASGWMNSVDRNATVWNPFLLKRAKEINDNIGKWNSTLREMSEETCGNEQAEPFDHEVSFAKFNDYYTHLGAPSIITILIGLVCYLLLLTPYMIQGRHTRNSYRLFGKKNNNGSDVSTGTFTLD